jgi:hypothetical protein
MNASPSPSKPWDPVFLHARREALLILAIWGAALLWCIISSTSAGYAEVISTDAEGSISIETIWGIPRWVFFGIALPWLAADLFAIWFCFFCMVDDDLGEAQEGLDLEEELAEIEGASHVQSSPEDAPRRDSEDSDDA